jgi:hypothetical protein
MKQAKPDHPNHTAHPCFGVSFSKNMTQPAHTAHQFLSTPKQNIRKMQHTAHAAHPCFAIPKTEKCTKNTSRPYAHTLFLYYPPYRLYIPDLYQIREGVIEERVW